MKKLVLSFALITISCITFAQVGIGTSTPESSAALELKSTTKGFLLPRLSISEIQAIEEPAEGLLMYCTDCDIKGIFVFNGLRYIGLINGKGLSAAIDSATFLAQIGTEADNNTSAITTAQLNAILPVLTGITNANESSYRSYIGNNAELFASPATPTEVQAAINTVNNIVNAVLEKIATQQTVTLQDLQWLSSSGRTDTKLESYNNYIEHYSSAFTDVRATLAEVTAMYTLLATNVASFTGKIWMDRNLGAANVATSTIDVTAYGGLYQWGRTTDGHQVKASKTFAGPVESGTEGADFITNADGGDWLSTPDDSRWTGETKGAQDPCPSGFRVPTITELNNEETSITHKSMLLLTRAGGRTSRDGELRVENTVGFYWSSSISSSKAQVLEIRQVRRDLRIQLVTRSRADGYAIRCIKE
ncbi:MULTISPECIES: FISUMP domain-containing protein [unclassified Polaribacter]|uniref:FISUMP domain-containing protein n=1 Tax=unclassified Polaribacter TaxID=196858 RepID=UPI0011BF66A5|nr:MULTISPECIES: FISUMP domain-containing protein [unclassified Polaribacter]TXD49563.1 hypothetical protein ES043_17210 [Polaribacter sp. IC063]TXD56211.1 hypothetical protein ES044_17280 [Polaribacter sp. IC066]